MALGTKLCLAYNRRMSENEKRQQPTSAQRSLALPPVKITPLRIVLLVALLVAVIFGVRFCSTAATINVTVNGSACTLHGAKTMQTAIKESGLPINPGDLISLTGKLLKADEGQPFSATVNGEETTDPSYKLNNGDVIVVTDGDDIVEDYDAVPEPIPYEIDWRGLGAISVFTKGENGVKEIRTGRLSGDVVEKTTVQPTDLAQRSYNPNVGDDKVIALTFDGGPNSTYTSQILDILAENEAKATFFCVTGEVGQPGSSSILKPMRDAGHQICVYGYADSTAFDASNYAKQSAEEQVADIVDCRAAIEKALGEEASSPVRLPSGYELYDVMLNLEQYVDTEIGWTIDTGDWANTSSDEIYTTLMMAKAGDIIRLHDGGGDRSSTVEALKNALPKLKEKGFSFVTVDDMLAYPQQ